LSFVTLNPLQKASKLVFNLCGAMLAVPNISEAFTAAIFGVEIQTSVRAVPLCTKK
jgi:hypothetical protein